MHPRRPPIGVVLAGGLGSRLGAEEKPLIELGGRPLYSYPLAALTEALGEAVVVAKQPLPGVTTWVEPPQPRHPLTGIIHALGTANRPVFVCAADMPHITAAEIRAVCAAGEGPLIVPRAAGRLQPLCALYDPVLLPELVNAPPDAPLTRTVEGLSPHVLERPSEPYANVNTPEDLSRT
jgi:molybdopterin-guanine dinucleotide biosynthesis protein A